MATSVAPAPGTSGAPAAPAEETFESAGRALLESLTDEQRNASGDALLDDLDGAARPSPAEAATDVGEPITREEDGAEFNETAGRWQLNGKFVAGAPPEGWTAPVKPDAAATAEPAADAAPAAAAEPTDAGVKVTLPGLSERGEEDIEVEVDKELADRIARLKNDGIRAKEFKARMGQVDQREAALEAYQQEMEIDPVGFHVNRMPAEQQLAVARALLIEHLDELLPDIAQLQDPTIRFRASRELRDGLKTSQERLTQQRAVSAAVREVVRATEALVPEGTDDATLQIFVADARRDLAAAAERGERVTPQTVKQLLARRLSLYGFDKPRQQASAAATPAKPAAPVVPAVPTARPATDRARDIAARARPSAGAGTADAIAAQARIRRTQAARNAGARVAPVGAGAAPVQTPAVPPEAEADIASMSKFLRKQGLPAGWGSGSE